uniref:RING-type E3 ubiquitin transferase n=1 Tax=Bubo bubo TaxID=30461 RepID=A0A8C0FU79_BUBBB
LAAAEVNRPSAPQRRRSMASASKDHCPICWNTLSNAALTMPCLHRFCFSCIRWWAEFKPQCPLCRGMIQPSVALLGSAQNKPPYRLPDPRVSRSGASQGGWHQRPMASTRSGASRRGWYRKQPMASTRLGACQGGWYWSLWLGSIFSSTGSTFANHQLKMWVSGYRSCWASRICQHGPPTHQVGTAGILMQWMK